VLVYSNSNQLPRVSVASKISCDIVAPSSSRPDEEKEIADAMEFAAPVIDQSHYNN
jgi:hypothetical protein